MLSPSAADIEVEAKLQKIYTLVMILYKVIKGKMFFFFVKVERTRSHIRHTKI